MDQSSIIAQADQAAVVSVRGIITLRLLLSRVSRFGFRCQNLADAIGMIKAWIRQWSGEY
jgi:hypothetical protein